MIMQQRDCSCIHRNLLYLSDFLERFKSSFRRVVQVRPILTFFLRMSNKTIFLRKYQTSTRLVPFERSRCEFTFVFFYFSHWTSPRGRRALTFCVGFLENCASLRSTTSRIQLLNVLTGKLSIKNAISWTPQKLIFTSLKKPHFFDKLRRLYLYNESYLTIEPPTRRCNSKNSTFWSVQMSICISWLWWSGRFISLKRFWART